MSVKILGGFLKGLSLQVPAGDLVRPTSILLRRRLFDWRQNLEGFSFVDLCAGSGAMGLEAFSRGALPVTLLEKNKKVGSTLKLNVEKAREWGADEELKALAQKKLNFHLMSAELYLSKKADSENTILFLDPPYADKALYFDLLALLAPWFKGEVWLESDQQKGVKENELSQLLTNIRPSFIQGSNFIVVGRCNPLP